MRDLFKAEFYKFKFYRTLPILMITILGIAILSATVTYLVQENIVMGKAALYQAPITDTYMFVFLAVLAAEIIISEYGRGTIKNLTAAGKSRLKLFCSKLCMLFLVSLLFAIFCIVVYAITYTIFFGWGNVFQWVDLLSILKLIGLYIPLLAGMTGIVMLVSILFRNPVGVIGICAGFSAVEIILLNLFGAIPALRNVLFYFPAALYASIAKMEPSGEEIIRVCIVGIALFLISTFGAYRIFKRQDIK